MEIGERPLLSYCPYCRFRDIVKLFPDAGKQVLACHQTVMLPETASIHVFEGAADLKEDVA